MSRTDEASMTQGVLNALNKNKNRTVCPDCAFPMPVYPGRYPTKCPNCGRDARDKGESGDA